MVERSTSPIRVRSDHARRVKAACEQSRACCEDEVTREEVIMSTLSHSHPRWHWQPWLTITVGWVIIVSPWLIALVLGTQFAVLNAVVVGTAVAIGVGVVTLVVLLLSMSRPT
jgi:hypothetical protein